MELTKLQNAIKNIIAKSSSTMQPEEIKAYNDALDKINDQLDRLKSPFSKTAISEIKEINRLNKELDAEKEKQQKLEQRRNDLEIQERELTSKLTNQKYHGAPQEEIDETISKIQETQEGIADINGDLNTTAGNIANIGNKLQKLYGGSSEGWAKANKALTETFRAIDGAVQIFNEVKDLAASFGADVDTGAWSDLSIIFSGIGEMSQKFQSGWQSFLSGDIVGGVAGLVGGLVAG
jgi:chromosome segregation ATPase